MTTPETLQALLVEGGFCWANTAILRQTQQGRIHQSWTVETGCDGDLLLQRLNCSVIADASQLASLTKMMLCHQGIIEPMVNWPSTASPVFEHSSGTWLCRKLVQAISPEQPCTRDQIRAMTESLHRFHQIMPGEEFRRLDYRSVNPWNPTATQTLADIASNPGMISNLNTADAELLRIYQHSASYVRAVSGSEENHRLTIVHRDPKPSNFLQLQSGDMILIDYDTTGIGDPVQDLGEMVRALACRDECEQLPLMTAEECKALLAQISNTYPDKNLTNDCLRKAACRSCLWQAARFLEDHFAGDLYYPVTYRGENGERASQQLTVFSHLSVVEP